MWTRVMKPVWLRVKTACQDVCYGIDTASAMGHGLAPRPVPERMRRTSRW